MKKGLEAEVKTSVSVHLKVFPSHIRVVVYIQKMDISYSRCYNSL